MQGVLFLRACPSHCTDKMQAWGIMPDAWVPGHAKQQSAVLILMGVVNTFPLALDHGLAACWGGMVGEGGDLRRGQAAVTSHPGAILTYQITSPIEAGWLDC